MKDGGKENKERKRMQRMDEGWRRIERIRIERMDER